MVSGCHAVGRKSVAGAANGELGRPYTSLCQADEVETVETKSSPRPHRTRQSLLKPIKSVAPHANENENEASSTPFVVDTRRYWRIYYSLFPSSLRKCLVHRHSALRCY